MAVRKVVKQVNFKAERVKWLQTFESDCRLL